MYYWIYWIIIVILACAIAYFQDRAKEQKRKKEHYKALWTDAKEGWATQSNAVRQKGIECAKWEKACAGWRAMCKKDEKKLKELQKKYDNFYNLVG